MVSGYYLPHLGLSTKFATTIRTHIESKQDKSTLRMSFSTVFRRIHLSKILLPYLTPNTLKSPEKLVPASQLRVRKAKKQRGLGIWLVVSGSTA